MKNKNFYAVILAGGAGTRFWPLSRHEEPKQFLKIIDGESLLRKTIVRLSPLVSPEQILIVTSRLYQKKIQAELKSFKIPSRNILLEPEGKNTAPAIAWAAKRILEKNPQGIMGIFPSDHLISQPKNFLKLLQGAIALAGQNYLVTMGIVPERPETGYGYLKVARRENGGETIDIVEKFVEKPTLDKARKYLEEGNYLWNSGMFVWKAQVFLDHLKQHLPAVAKIFDHDEKTLLRNWAKLPSVSVDYGILEKAADVVTVPASGIGWSDLGSWEALVDILAKRPSKANPDQIVIDCQNTFVFSGKKIVAAIGLENVTIVDTPDALLVCRTEQSQKVKDIVGNLKKRGRPQWLRHTGR